MSTRAVARVSKRMSPLRQEAYMSMPRSARSVASSMGEQVLRDSPRTTCALGSETERSLCSLCSLWPIASRT